MAEKHRITVNLNDEEYQTLQRIMGRTDRSLARPGRQASGNCTERRKMSKSPFLARLSDRNASLKKAVR